MQLFGVFNFRLSYVSCDPDLSGFENQFVVISFPQIGVLVA